ncbi:MAG: hypothetical protein M3179_15065 [Actinomycetota bacterium]|nr:hypothetical protein [Actinomycetota bacterium]
MSLVEEIQNLLDGNDETVETIERLHAMTADASKEGYLSVSFFDIGLVFDVMNARIDGLTQAVLRLAQHLEQN